jgi:hypothetical protein
MVGSGRCLSDLIQRSTEAKTSLIIWLPGVGQILMRRVDLEQLDLRIIEGAIGPSAPHDATRHLRVLFWCLWVFDPSPQTGRKSKSGHIAAVVMLR